MISKGRQRSAKSIEGPAITAKIYRWQSKTALLMALGMIPTAALPTLIATPAVAEQQPYITGQLSQSSQVVVPAGTTIPVRYDGAEKIIITPNETAPVTLIVAKNIRSNSGRILIPVGSQVKGQLRPASGGSQFFSQHLTFSNTGQRLPINAVSEIITTSQTITQKTSPNFLGGAALGAAAGALLGGIFGGRVGIGQILPGAALGAGAAALQGGRKKETKVVVIDPDTDLHLFLRADFSTGISSANFTPLSRSQCETLRSVVAQRLGVGVTLSTGRFQDYVNRKSGTGCLLTATGTGRQFRSPVEVIRKVGGVLTELGWGEEPAYEAGGPTGASAGYSQFNNFGLLNAAWEPAPGVSCPSNQPIASCALAPGQKLYVITLNLAQAASF